MTAQRCTPRKRLTYIPPPSPTPFPRSVEESLYSRLLTSPPPQITTVNDSTHSRVLWGGAIFECMVVIAMPTAQVVYLFEQKRMV